LVEESTGGVHVVTMMMMMTAIGEQALVDGVGGELADDEVQLGQLGDCVRVLGGHRLGHLMAAAAYGSSE
jgi:hypothetical protein